MPKASGSKAHAARKREASKRGETVPEARPDPSVLTDPTYQPEPDKPVPKTVEQESGHSDLAQKRKLRRENADILPERPTKISRTTGWRNDTGQTKKSRAKSFQKSIASIFQKILPSKKMREIEGKKQEDEEEEKGMSLEEDGIEILSHEKTDEEMAVVIPRAQSIIDIDDSDNESNSDVEMVPSTTCESINTNDPEDLPSPVSPNTEIIEAEVTVTQADDDEYIVTVVSEVQPLPGPSIQTNENVSSTSAPVNLASNSNERDSGEPKNDDAKGMWTAADHQRLHKLIEKHRARLRKKKILVTDTSAASTLIDLEALSQYNDLRLKLSNEKADLQRRLASTPRQLKHNIRKRIAKIRPATDASNSVAGRCGRGPYFAKTLRGMAHELLHSGLLPDNKQGKGAHHETLLNNPGVSSALREWVKGLLDVEEGGFKGRMRPAKLRRYVNDFLFPRLKIQDTIGESTAVRWLKSLGFKLSRVQKGVYVDGHERPDVVATRTEFINYIYTQVLPFSYTYEGAELVETAPTLPDGAKIHYPIFHDETCIHANDLDNYVWMRDGEQPLRNKSRGRIVHVSDFIIEHCGRLCLSAAEIAEQMKLPVRPSSPTSPTTPGPAATDTTSVEVPCAETTTTSKKGKGRAKKAPKEKNTKKTSPEGRTYTEQENEWVPPPPPAPFKSYCVSNFDARRIIYPGANYDPWWDMPQLIVQTKNAIEIFEAKYPDGVAVFIFDCSSAHEAYPADALLAHKMNRGPGGKQPVMRDTVIPSTGVPQSMVFPADYTGVDKDGQSLAGKPKGMEQVLRERNLLSLLERKHGNKVVGICAMCKKSQAAREAALKLAKSKEDELEGSSIPSLNSRGVSDLDEDDLLRPKDCCMQRVLSLEKDFREEKPLLQLVIEKAGHKCLFLPKFHCELNPIEMVWGQTKQRFREYADGTFATAKTLVLECLDAVSTDNIRQYFRHCWRYMDAYRRGLNIKQAAYAVKKYTSHRRIPAAIVMDINIIQWGTTG